MCRRFSAILFLAGLPLQVFAEPTRLTLVPAAAPKPSLKYALLTDSHEANSGNAATLYYRSLGLYFENKALLEDNHQEYWHKWLTGPLEDLRAKEVGEKLARYGSLLREVEIASQCNRCDWQLDGRREGIGLLLPDLSAFRHLAMVLAVRARHEIATGRPEVAVTMLRTGFTLARHLGEGPTLIHAIVGSAVANMMCDRVEELSELPGAPNLYWALTTMPRPFLDAQVALREQSEVFEQMFPWLKRMEQGPLSLSQVQETMAGLQRVVDDFNIRKPEAANLRLATLVTALHADAKRYLIGHGFAPDMVEAMPSLQAVTLAAFREYRESSQEVAKWFYVRDGLRTPRCKEAEARYREATSRLDQLFFHGLLRGLQEDRSPLEPIAAARDRLDRRLAALRCIESIRVYAAAHDDKLPAALADLVDAPAPDDPVGGKPFDYKLTGEKATLRASPIPGDKAAKASEYELTVRR
jgi:hypothetical protein